MPVEESQAAMEASWYCWVTCSGWSHHHSLPLPTCQHSPINAWRPELQSKTPGWGGPMCLMRWTAEKDPRQGSPLSAWRGGATEKDWPKRPSEGQLQEARKKTPIGPGLLRRRQSVSLHAWRHQGPRKPSSCAPFTLSSRWGRAATGKESLVSVRAGSLGSCLTLCHPADCGLPGFSVREEVLQARLLRRIGQHWLPYPSRALYFLPP